MRTTTEKIEYAVQRQNSDFDDWNTIQTSITPHEARARQLMRWQQDLRTQFQFRVVKLETQTTVIPIEEARSRGAAKSNRSPRRMPR